MHIRNMFQSVTTPKFITRTKISVLTYTSRLCYLHFQHNDEQWNQILKIWVCWSAGCPWTFDIASQQMFRGLNSVTCWSIIQTIVNSFFFTLSFKGYYYNYLCIPCLIQQSNYSPWFLHKIDEKQEIRLHNMTKPQN
jgi:hypothetical protein